MNSWNVTASPPTDGCHYFDSNFEQHESSYPLTQPPQSVSLYINRERSLSLVLINNRWTYFEWFCWFGCGVSHPAGFVFQHCIACGVERFTNKEFPHASILSTQNPFLCGNKECFTKFPSPRFNDREAAEIIFAVWGRNARLLKIYSARYKSNEAESRGSTNI